MVLSGVVRYPIKSARGEQLGTATLTAEGIEGDRRFMVTTSSYRHLTQREHPQLATLSASFGGGASSGRGDSVAWPLSLSWGGKTHTVGARHDRNVSVTGSIFGQEIALRDLGGEVAGWLEKRLGAGGKAWAPNLPSIASLLGQPRFRLARVPASSGRRAGLADASPILLLCEESVAGLNARRAASGLPPTGVDRFRPNLVVAGCARAHAEDEWVGSHIRVGSARFRIDSRCPRCTVPDVSQQSGAVDSPASGPMRTLKGYRAMGGGVQFGVYATPLTVGAQVRVGDEVAIV